MFEPVEILGYVAMVLIWTGLYLLTIKRRIGWLSGLAGCLLWIVYGLALALWPILITNVVFCIINTRGYLKWKA